METEIDQQEETSFGNTETNGKSIQFPHIVCCDIG